MKAGERSVPARTGEQPPRCSPCRGTGRVISRLGGQEQEVTCPWCEGKGTILPEHDAQAPRRGDRAG